MAKLGERERGGFSLKFLLRVIALAINLRIIAFVIHLRIIAFFIQRVQNRFCEVINLTSRTMKQRLTYLVM